MLLLAGAFSKIGRSSPTTQPNKVLFLNKAHSYFGWFYIICAKVPLLSGWFRPNRVLFGFIIAITLLSYGIYLYLKFFGKRIESVSISRNNKIELMR